MQPALTISDPADVGAAFGRASAALRATPLRITADMLPVISARLVCGDFEAVRALLRDPTPASALPLSAARYLAWSGDLQTVMAIFEDVRESLPLVDQLQPNLRHATWSELQRTATDAGDPVLASQLVTRAHAEAADISEAVFPSPADLVLDVARTLLGIEADAPRGRIRLRPHMGAHAAIVVRELRFADGSIDFSAERLHDRVEFRVEQASGALPFTIILEPVLEAALGATIDGATADLHVQPHEHGVAVPVQLVLDNVRRLVVRTR